ncbi:hypothetical protein BQ8482_320005 [Mesorhizobium delmotii]|uniref:Uncharacterized protein n=1 Tax=Mesorhizobium delmotii TaxID=1631247 RepID=A0A2P9ANX3_9HYPH|nr:hypothetical protein BQ8482_320005 [Mesorhizobium delmotii]
MASPTRGADTCLGAKRRHIRRPADPELQYSTPYYRRLLLTSRSLWESQGGLTTDGIVIWRNRR